MEKIARKHFLQSAKWLKLRKSPLLFVALFAAIGTVLLFSSHAATPFASIEPEQGTTTPNIVPVNDVAASGGAAIKFGGSGAGGNNGLLTGDPNFFPIAVWLQTPESSAAQYRAIGINTFAGLYSGPNQSNLTALRDNNIFAVIEQDNFGLTSPLNGVIKSWLQQDEPDNAQSNPSGGYDPCIDPSVIIQRYNQFKAADPTRPVLLGLGRGVADINWVGRGTCTGRTDMYTEYAKGADILAYDIYPVNNGDPLEIVATGVDNLRRWSNYSKPVWMDIETTAYDQANGKPTPSQVKTEVWMALTHGAAGIDYFVHIFTPTFHEAGLLTDAVMTNAVSAINSQIQALAPVLNSPNVPSAANVTSSNTNVPIDYMVKKYGGATYVFAVAMRGTATTGNITISGQTTGTVQSLDDGRTLTVSGGKFTDSFAGYGVHLYKVLP